MASFHLAQVVHSIADHDEDSWGPSTLPERFRDLIYLPYSKSDRIGKIADWNIDTEDGINGGNNTYAYNNMNKGGENNNNKRHNNNNNNNKRGEQYQPFGAGYAANAYEFTNPLDNEDGAFSLVDNTKSSGNPLARSKFPGGGNNSRGGNNSGRGGGNNRMGRSNGSGRGTGYGNARGNNRDARSQYQRLGDSVTGGNASIASQLGGSNSTGKNNIGNNSASMGNNSNNSRQKQNNSGGGNSNNGGAGGRWDHNNNKQTRMREASLPVLSEWELVEDIDFARLGKLSFDPPQGTVVSEHGEINHYDLSYDRITTKSSKALGHTNKNWAHVTTSEDPILKNLAANGQGQVFATDVILSLLMCSSRTVYPWDLIITRRNGQLFFDHRESLAIGKNR